MDSSWWNYRTNLKYHPGTHETVQKKREKVQHISFRDKERCERRCIEGTHENSAKASDEEISKRNVVIKLSANSQRPYQVGDKVHDHSTRVIISHAEASDSGEYRCAVGPDGLLSDAQVVKVIGEKWSH
ncbi:hypothetical protein COOONC_13368 [Cooperia oncophora]